MSRRLLKKAVQLAAEARENKKDRQVSVAICHTYLYYFVPIGAETYGAFVSFSSCQRNLIKTFQIEGMIAPITKMDLIFS